MGLRLCRAEQAFDAARALGCEEEGVAAGLEVAGQGRVLAEERGSVSVGDLLQRATVDGGAAGAAKVTALRGFWQDVQAKAASAASAVVEASGSAASAAARSALAQVEEEKAALEEGNRQLVAKVDGLEAQVRRLLPPSRWPVGGKRSCREHPWH
jgi:hypothetical protein